MTNSSTTVDMSSLSRSLIILFVSLGLVHPTTHIRAEGADNPFYLHDGDAVSVSGKVLSLSTSKGQGFLLDHGNGVIPVEVDRVYTKAELYVLPAKGKRVRVEGVIDNDRYENRSIEAKSVTILDDSRTIKSSVRDDLYIEAADPAYAVTSTTGPVKLEGRVVYASALAEEFGLLVGERRVTVKTTELPYNPFVVASAEVSLQPGEKVVVYGQYDRDLLSPDDLIATRIRRLP